MVDHLELLKHQRTCAAVLLFDESRCDCGQRPASLQSPLKLNLGCSDSHLKGYINVDRVPPADQIVDLAVGEAWHVRDGKHLLGWQWLDSSVDEIKAWDIFEHLPNKLFTMNEAHRVLKPGAKLDLLVPTTDGRGAFQDPTHKSWWTPNDIFYFSDVHPEWQRFHVSYGITANFKVISGEHKEYASKVWKMRWVLQAVKR